MYKLEIIFLDEPIQWGLRGDPYFWKELKNYFKNKLLPYSIEDFTTEFYSLFETIAKCKLGEEKMSNVPEYVKPNGGMSNGKLSHKFWLKKGLPLLKQRLESYNNQIEKEV